jgi:hypothetical protein
MYGGKALAAAGVLMLAALPAMTVSGAASASALQPTTGDSSRLAAVCAAQKDLFATRADDAARADGLLSGVVKVTDFPPQPLPDDIDWAHPPLTTSNFQAQFQALNWADPLRREYLRTGDERYLERYEAILRDFVTDNPDHTAPLTPWSWYDFSEGRRGTILGCAVLLLGAEDWLMDGLREHVASISEPGHYSGIGNHSLMQNAGLITLGVALEEQQALELARTRAQDLLPKAISTDGVSLEGSVHYHGLNHIWWREFCAIVDAAGLGGLDLADRVLPMAAFGESATFPDGTSVNFGDGFPSAGSRYRPGGPALAIYRPGYLFSRSSATVGPSMLAVHYGQSFDDMPHGHMDAGTIELFAAGKRLISDSGPYAYGGGFWRNWAKSASAHNVISSPGTAYLKGATSKLVNYKRDAYWMTATWSLPVMSRVTWYRTIKQSLRHGWIVVMDEVSAPTSRPWVSRWNLPDDEAYRVKPYRIDQATGSGGRVSIVQIAGTPTVSLVEGKVTKYLSTTSGWRSYSYETIEPAPTAELSKTASSWRVVTLIAPRAAGELADTVTVTGVRATTTQVSFTVTTARGRTTLTMARLPRP